MNKKSGFTLIELLLVSPIVIAIIIVIFCVVQGLFKGEDIHYCLSVAWYYFRCIITYGGIVLLAIIGCLCLFIELNASVYLFILVLVLYIGIGILGNKSLFEEKIAIQNQLEQKKKDEEKAKKQLKDKNLKIELIAFSKEKIPELYNAINETSRMREEIKIKKEKLTEVLIKLDKDYKADEDIKRYEELLSRLNVADIEYDKMLKEGYLQYKKFEISSDPSYEKMLENYNNKAKQSLNENVDSFNKMRNQLSEQRNNE